MMEPLRTLTVPLASMKNTLMLIITEAYVMQIFLISNHQFRILQNRSGVILN